MDAIALEQDQAARKLVQLSSQKKQADRELDTLSDFQILEREFFSGGSTEDNEKEMEMDLQKVRGKLEAIEEETKVTKEQEDSLTEKLKKGDSLRSRLAREMGVVQKALSIEKEKQRARIASYLELKRKMNSSLVPQSLSSKRELSKLEEKWLSQLNG